METLINKMNTLIQTLNKYSSNDDIQKTEKENEKLNEVLNKNQNKNDKKDENLNENDEKDEKDNKNNEILNTIFNEMIYDLENVKSFKHNCDKDENN